MIILRFYTVEPVANLKKKKIIFTNIVYLHMSVIFREQIDACTGTKMCFKLGTKSFDV